MIHSGRPGTLVLVSKIRDQNEHWAWQQTLGKLDGQNNQYKSIRL